MVTTSLSPLPQAPIRLSRKPHTSPSSKREGADVLSIGGKAIRFNVRSLVGAYGE